MLGECSKSKTNCEMLSFLEIGHKDGAFKKAFLLYCQDPSQHAKTDCLSKTYCVYLYREQKEPRSMAFTELVDAGISLLGLRGVGQGTPDLCSWPGLAMGMETLLFHQSHASAATVAQQPRGG